MIVGFGKIHTFTRDTHTNTRCLGRRLLLVENIGFYRRVQSNTKLLQTYTVHLTKHLTNAFIQTQTVIYL